MNRVDFLLDADELAPVIKALQDALTRRPNPEGEPHFELQPALDSCDKYFESVRELTEATGKLSAHDLLEAANGMSSGYRCFWERPFPQGLEMGQPLFSAVLERPMRDLLRTLQSLTEAESEDYLGEPLITLDAEEELNCFNTWLDGLAPHQRIGLRPSQGCGLGALAASFLLGWWFGRD